MVKTPSLAPTKPWVVAEVLRGRLLPVKTLPVDSFQSETQTSITPVVVDLEQEVPEETHHHLDQLQRGQMVEPVVEEFHQRSRAPLFVMQPVVVVVFTGMAAALEPVVPVLRQTQLLVVLVEKVACCQTLHSTL
jgi:hypothetical protein